MNLDPKSHSPVTAQTHPSNIIQRVHHYLETPNFSFLYIYAFYYTLSLLNKVKLKNKTTGLPVPTNLNLT